ncbi:MAG: radical SAM protein [Candidatus Omnitrophica bacterium]|nr:radical SAM protein [Candidatus Omnitrophota bacterium]
MRKFDASQRVCLLDAVSASGLMSCASSSLLFQKIALFLKLNDYTVVKRPSHADILIFNTCGITDAFAKINNNYINQFVKAPKKVIVFGCLCKVSEDIRKSGHILIPPGSIHQFSDYFDYRVRIEDVSASMCTVSYVGKKALRPLLIAQGCLNKCSYCNIKIAKGALQSRCQKDILEDIKRFIKEKSFEVMLIADDCGCWGHDSGANIVELVDEILRIDKRIKIGLFNFYPSLFLKYYPFLKKHILDKRITYLLTPLQSGSSRILKLMKRSYSLSLMMKTIKEIKAYNSKIRLESHFIINFPTETMEDFKKCLHLARFFDNVDFVEYQDNRLTEASQIFPKCPGNQALLKKDLFMLYQKKGLLKGKFYLSFSRQK